MPDPAPAPAPAANAESDILDSNIIVLPGASPAVAPGETLVLLRFEDMWRYAVIAPLPTPVTPPVDVPVPPPVATPTPAPAPSA